MRVIKKILTRAGLIVMVPLLPVALAVDIAIGDKMTGVKTTIKAKALDQYSLWINYWNEA